MYWLLLYGIQVLQWWVVCFVWRPMVVREKIYRMRISKYGLPLQKHQQLGKTGAPSNTWIKHHFLKYVGENTEGSRNERFFKTFDPRRIIFKAEILYRLSNTNMIFKLWFFLWHRKHLVYKPYNWNYGQFNLLLTGSIAAWINKDGVQNNNIYLVYLYQKLSGKLSQWIDSLKFPDSFKMHCL